MNPSDTDWWAQSRFVYNLTSCLSHATRGGELPQQHREFLARIGCASDAASIRARRDSERHRLGQMRQS